MACERQKTSHKIIYHRTGSAPGGGGGGVGGSGTPIYPRKSPQKLPPYTQNSKGRSIPHIKD